MVDPPTPVRPTGAPSVALTLPRVPRTAFGQFLPTGRLRPSGDPVPPAAVAMGYTQDAWDHLLPGLQQMYRNAPAPQTTPGSQPAGARPSTPVPAALEGRVSQQTWDEASDAQRTAMLAAAGPSSASVAWQTVGQGLGALGTTISTIINSGNQREIELARIASGDNNAAAQRDLQMRALEVQRSIEEIRAQSNTTNAAQLAPLMSLLQQQADAIHNLQAQAQQPPASTGMSTGAIVGLAVAGVAVVGVSAVVLMKQGRGRDDFRPNPSCSCTSKGGTRKNPCACGSRKNPSARRHHGFFRGHAERVRRSPGAYL